MINGSFVFGMDDDDETVFDRTVEWAIEQGIETATFHILTPYPGTALHSRMAAQGRIMSDDWDLYDTRHVVFRPARHDAGEARGRLPARLSRLLPLGLDLRGARAHDSVARAAAASRLRRRLEEVRAAVGLRHSREARRDDAAAARNDPQRVRQTRH